MTPEAMDIECGDVSPYQCKESRYRAFNGSCNNLLHPTWGMPYTRSKRILHAAYADGIRTPRLSLSGKPLPLPRVVSFKLFPNVSMHDKQFTLVTMQYGQVIAEDITLVDRPKSSPANQCCSIERKLDKDYLKKPLCYPFLIPKDDPDYKNSGVECIERFIRTTTDLDRGCSIRKGAVTQLALITHTLDLSPVYGFNDKAAASVRELKGGRLRVERRNNHDWPPIIREQYFSCNGTINTCYRLGDARVNQNADLAIMLIILMREHNRIADCIAKLNSDWPDEKIFHEARRILIALYQSISYNEWLPLILGRENCYKNKLIYETKEYVNDYDPSVDPTITNEFAAAAFRSFHSTIAGNLKRYNEDRQFAYSSSRFGEHFFNQTVIENCDNFDGLLRGLCTQPQEAADKYYDKEITVFMSGITPTTGMDLRGFDIHRGRDHGLRPYIDYRIHCGLSKDVKKLSELYETPADVDLTVGASLEKNIPDSMAGPTFHCLLTKQFLNTRIGDRFWFENGKSGTPFTLIQLNEIRKASISRLICDNANDIKSMQLKGFELISKKNPLLDCQDIPSIDLSLWKESASKK
ncbi:peroxidase-like [Belonocnema kinseyi]|uniref:peroxidase-like n=1 Tax=Belonocnema kinseyi TaxID=2817044 RepID=UPI00143D6489|nr:peroxidase-like [Belonocnema kinseyi]